MATICGVSHFVSASWRLANFCFVPLDGIQYVEHAKGHGDRMFEAVCKLGLENFVSKKLDAPYRSGPVENLVRSEKSEGAGSHPRRRWNVLSVVIRGSCVFGLYSFSRKQLQTY
jgi:hypothetical protein